MLTPVLSPNISALEIFWLIVTGVGLILNFWGVSEAWFDLLALRISHTSNRALLFIAAISNLRRELVFVFIQALFFGLGVASALAPPYHSSVSELDLSELVMVGAFIVAALAMTIDGALSRQERRVAIRMYQQERHDDVSPRR